MSADTPISAEFPFESKTVTVHGSRLQKSSLPKLLFAATPGGILDAKGVQWCRDHLENLEVIDIGKGIHYLQEDNPHRIGEGLARWVQGLG